MLYTVGHGTLDRESLGDLLLAATIDVVVDVRRFPGSRRSPHVGRDELARWLPDRGVSYRWVEDLGGRRPVRRDSPHVALRNDAFRGYADHMETPAFRTALAEVVAGSAERRVAAMCSESVWWRCHRRLIADAVTLLHGTDVRHLMHDRRVVEHVLTEGVRRDGDVLRYDVGAQPAFNLSD